MKDLTLKEKLLIILLVWAIGFIFLVVFVLPAQAQEIDIGAIIQIESDGDPHAYNKKSGAIGLMQITYIVLEEYNQVTAAYPGATQTHLYDSWWNVYIGRWYIERIKNHYLKGKGTATDVLVCWHDGYGNWRKWKAGKRKLGKEMRGFLRKYEKATR